jgi:hypothetical protein
MTTWNLPPPPSLSLKAARLIRAPGDVPPAPDDDGGTPDQGTGDL